MNKVSALIFDVDGTLADTEKDGHRVAFNMAFSQAGLDWNWSEPLYGDLLCVTGGKERIKYYIDKYLNDFSEPADLNGFITSLHLAKNRIYAELLAEGRIPVRPGVKRLLEEAREKGMRLAIATTTSPENVRALLVHALHPEAESWFEVIAAGDIVPAKKPAPDIYLYALQRLNLAPDQCIAFEDSENGIKSAHDAGLKTIVTVNDYTRSHEFSTAVIVLNHLGEPGQAFNVLRGDAKGATYLDVNLVEQLHGE